MYCGAASLKSVHTDPTGVNKLGGGFVHTLTFYCVILNVFVGHRGCHGQAIAPDTGGDVRDTEGQSTSVLLVNESRHFAGFKILVCCQCPKKRETESFLNRVGVVVWGFFFTFNESRNRGKQHKIITN